MEPFTLRALERLLAVAISALCIYFGYSLLLHMPEKEGEAKVKLPGGVSIFISRVGPGVFFALFGAAIVAISLYQGIVYFRSYGVGVQQVFYGGLTTGGGGALDQARLRLGLDLEFLNTLPITDLDDQRRRELATRITSTKLALMRTVWGPDWGDFDEFIEWAESGASSPVPKRLEAAAAYYSAGREVNK